MNVAAPAKRGPDYISLCTGGGGLDLAVELAIPSARAVCLLEREAFAVAHLVEAMRQGLMAPAPVWSDVRTFNGRQFRGCVDGVIGGIPCQPHSLAGKRLAEEGERDLWSPARRIIVQSGAWFCFIENVGGMLSSGGAERVWRDLQRLGFAVEGGLFTASEVGASHQRERFFILAVADTCFKPRCAEQEQQPDQRPDVTRRGSQNLADAIRPRLQGRGSSGSGPGQREASERGGCDVVDADGARRPPSRSGRPFDAGAEPQPGDGSLVDAVDRRRGRRPDDALGRQIERTPDEGAGGLSLFPPGHGDIEAMADADIAQLRQEPSAGQLAFLQQDDGVGLFPPGPGDIAGWRAVLARAPELEPAVRRLAHELAATRIDWLRLLGNGVVPLVGALAIRTLATRLADSGSAGATELVRMMEE